MSELTPVSYITGINVTPLHRAFPELCQPVSHSLPGRVLKGRYRVHAKLGCGGMSTVHIARDIRKGKLYAIKVIRADLRHNLRQRFFNEIKAVQLIDHPNVVKMFSIGELEDGRLYLVMEYIDGPPLRKLIKKKIPLAERGFPIIRAIAEGLRAAHRQGVIHRDLKPTNVLIPQQIGNAVPAKVLDFGLARIKDSPRITTTSQVMGTPHYISPEQAVGKPFDHRVDIYALGVIMYEIFTGRLPFSGDDPVHILEQHARNPVIPIRKRAPDIVIPSEVEDLVMACLAKSPKARPENMDEVLSVLSKVETMFGLGR